MASSVDKEIQDILSNLAKSANDAAEYVQRRVSGKKSFQILFH